MNFLGIGPGEIFLILILLLVVVGPERLPGFARAAGRFVVRTRDWIARSPDAQMVLRAREDLEQELNELRRSLTEDVEMVRKELEDVRGDLAEATRMVEESAEEVARTRIELDEPTAPPATAHMSAPADTPVQASDAAPAAETAAPDLAPAHADALASAPADATPPIEPAPAASAAPPNGQPVPRAFKPGREPAPQPAPAADDAAIDSLARRIQALGDDFNRQVAQLTAELTALRERPAALPALQPPAPPDPPAASAAPSPAEPAAVLSAEHARAPEDLRRRCKGVTRSGERCGAPPLKGQDYCRAHIGQRVLEEVPS